MLVRDDCYTKYRTERALSNLVDELRNNNFQVEHIVDLINHTLVPIFMCANQDGLEKVLTTVERLTILAKEKQRTTIMTELILLDKCSFFQ